MLTLFIPMYRKLEAVITRYGLMTASCFKGGICKMLDMEPVTDAHQFC